MKAGLREKGAITNPSRLQHHGQHYEFINTCTVKL